ncbi:MAG: tetratricopeptide repeat protein [Reyranella sp.]|uniref:tetratricopeptide repeat protein n=1 Tax=Reyranella sp. TaxID=1929291 RepID=UPI00120ADC46|nr:tetratricopeptide repeat protein [Reyranella sp.]TAJ85520.1 MAG: tetratricopeptide repeat protein [Reyranella sp.]TBR26972.1 MAG: tetratricopeptide repeat protein [Reyranella sp.]
MLTDRYGLTVSTTDAAARDAYVEGVDLLLTVYPGAAASFERAIAADPAFALAYIGRARASQLAGKLEAMRADLAMASSLAEGVSARERSQIDVFARLFAGQPVAALAALRAHVQTCPRDALVLSLAANQGGLIGMSGLSGREQDLADFLDRLAPHYGEDWWFNAHRGMALSEIGRHDEARPMIERSLGQYRRNAYGAHALAHLCYETGERDEGIAFLRDWLPLYDRGGGLFGHLSWHLGLFELHAGNLDGGLRLYTDAFCADDHRGAVHQKLSDSAAFLWRAELAGHPHDSARWARLKDYAREKLPRPGMSLADWHVALTYAATGDDDALEDWIRAIEELAGAGRYPSGSVIPAVARAFAAYRRGDHATTIDLIEPILPERERIGGSRAQGDLVEATLLHAYLASGREAEARRLIADRRPGPAGLPVSGPD